MRMFIGAALLGSLIFGSGNPPAVREVGAAGRPAAVSTILPSGPVLSMSESQVSQAEEPAAVVSPAVQQLLAQLDDANPRVRLRALEQLLAQNFRNEVGLAGSGTPNARRALPPAGGDPTNCMVSAS